MIENLYTTKMSTDRKKLQRRFTEIRSGAGRRSRAAALLVLLALLFSITGISVYMVINEDDMTHITAIVEDEGGKTVELSDVSEQVQTILPDDTKKAVAVVKYEKPKSHTNKKSLYVNSEAKDTEPEPEDKPVFSFEKTDTKALETKDVERVLIATGAVEADDGLKSGAEYDVRIYSYENNCEDVLTNVACSENGEVSMYFNMNAGNNVGVKFTDRISGEVVGSVVIPVENGDFYTFSGLESSALYDIEIQGETKGNWKIEGQYIVY